MKKTLLLIPLFAILLAIPVACAGTFNMDVSGSGGIGFYFISSDAHGAILQGYSGDGTVDYEASYTDGTLDTNIESTGSGSFGTILLPANSWSADASYTDDGSPVSDSGSGTTLAIFPHSWTSSFSGGGWYSVN
jgi:hypothetical protein